MHRIQFFQAYLAQSPQDLGQVDLMNLPIEELLQYLLIQLQLELKSRQAVEVQYCGSI